MIVRWVKGLKRGRRVVERREEVVRIVAKGDSTMMLGDSADATVAFGR